MSLNSTSASITFVSIIGGKFRQTVPEGTPGAVKREYETSDGKEGVKHELVFDDVDGVITDLVFADTPFGKAMHLTIDGVTISTGTDGRYFGDIIKKLAGLDLTKPVKLKPYDFEPDGKKKTGVTVYQDGDKIPNYFYDGKKNLHGFPETGDTEGFDSDDWKIYFTQVKKFLVKYAEENFKFEKEGKPNNDADFEAPKEVDPEDLPF